MPNNFENACDIGFETEEDYNDFLESDRGDELVRMYAELMNC